MFKKQSLKKNIKKSKNVKELLNNIINIALKYKANNIHLEPHGYHYHIRYRINKELKKVGRMPFALGENIITHLQKIKDKNDNFTLEVTPKKSVHINNALRPKYILRKWLTLPETKTSFLFFFFFPFINN